MSIGGQYIVSLSYREGEIIDIYHNQSLTSAFPTSVYISSLAFIARLWKYPTVAIEVY